MKAVQTIPSEHVIPCEDYWISKRSFYIAEHLSPQTLNDLIAAKAWTPKAGRRIPRFRQKPGADPSRLFCTRPDYNAWKARAGR